MKIKSVIIIILFACTNNIFGQISGKILLESDSCPGVEIKYKKSEKSVQTDFDGFFLLSTKYKGIEDNLLMTFIDLTVEIVNFKSKNKEIKLGNINFPYFKSVEIDEYKNLSETEQKNCIPIKHYTQLLGYYNCNKLENDYITLNCNHKITNFEYIPETRTIKVDWNLIKKCE